MKKSLFNILKKQNPARPQNSGYSHGSASSTKRAFKGFTARSYSPNQDINWNNYTMRQRGRIAYMSCPLGTSVIKSYRTNIVGTGLKVKPKINGALLGFSEQKTFELQQQIEREWRLWAEDKRACDATGVNDFYGMQQLALISWLMSGDVFAVKKFYKETQTHPYSTRWHLIEADRIATPTNSGRPHLSWNMTDGVAENGNKIFDGVEVDKNGLVQAYYVCNHYPNEVSSDATEYVRVAALGDKTQLPNILHLMNSERPDQYRGVSIMAQVLEPLLQSKRYADAELMAAVIENYFTGFITSENTTDIAINEVGSGNPNEPEVSTSENELELGVGTFNYLKPGESITFADPKRPNSGFQPFMEAIANQIGGATELPPEMIVKKFNSNYSASRAAFIEAWRAFKMIRSWFISDFCQPIYEAWLTEAVARGRIVAPGFLDNPVAKQIYCQCDWIGPAMSQIDPLKEVQALEKAIDIGVLTRESATMTYSGVDFFNNATQLKRENEALAAAKTPLIKAENGSNNSLFLDNGVQEDDDSSNYSAPDDASDETSGE